MNSVTAGDYERPIQISQFVAELNGGFRLLNLKNDALRKRFDALKYVSALLFSNSIFISMK